MHQFRHVARLIFFHFFFGGGEAGGQRTKLEAALTLLCIYLLRMLKVRKCRKFYHFLDNAINQLEIFYGNAYMFSDRLQFIKLKCSATKNN